MTHPLALAAVSNLVQESNDTISQAADDPTLDWEEVTSIASRENRRILQAMERADAVAAEFIEASTNHAIAAGTYMFQQAARHEDPDFIPDLLEGVSALVARVRQGAELGHPLPMNYMDPQVRKELYLVESYMRASETQA